MKKHHLMSEEPDAFGRIPRGGGGHHPWASRDYLDVDCRAVGCKYNRDEKCMVPSLCRIGDDGKCKGFTPKPPPQQIDGD